MNRARLIQVSRAAGEAISEADQIEFFRQVAFTRELTSIVRGAARNAGLTLGALRISARTVPMQRRGLDDILETVAGDFDRTVERIAALQSPEQFGRLAWYLSRGSEALTESWVNAILAGPHTTMVNLLGSAGIAAAAFPERLMAAGVRGITGGQGASIREATGFLFGSLNGIRDGLRLASKAIRTGRPTALRDLAGVTDDFIQSELRGDKITAANFGLDITSLPGRAVDTLGTVVRVPTQRFLLSGDEFFKAVGYRSELHALAARSAQQRGLTGRAFGDEVQRIILDPPEELIMEAVDAARVRSLQAPLGNFGRALQRSTNKHFAAKFFLPFVRTPTNILKMAVSRSPLAPVQRSFREAVRAGGARRDLALGQVALGTMVSTEVANLALTGRITGPGPSDQTIKETWLRAGWRPWSVLLPTGDGSMAYVSYNRLDPVGVLFGLSAALTEILGQLEANEPDEAVGALLTAVSTQILDKTYLRTISNLMEAFFEPSPEVSSDRIGRFLSTSAGSFVPFSAFFNQLRRGLDPSLRDTDELALTTRAMLPVADIISRLREKTPSYSETLPARRNLFGEPIAYFGGFGSDNANDAIDPSFSYFNTALRLVSPLNIQELSRDEVDVEMLRLSSLDLAIPFPPQTSRAPIDGVDLTAEEESQFLLEAGSDAKRRIRSILAGSSPISDTYQSLNDAGKARLLSRIISESRLLPRERLRRSPRIRDEVRRRLREAQSPGLASLTQDAPIPEPAR